MKNVLLLCMSTIRQDAKKNTYSFENQKGEKEYVEGYMTNEPPTKAVIKQLENLGDGQRLDRVVMICSDAVHKNIKLKHGENDLEKIETYSVEQIESYSHVEFYKERIHNFAVQVNQEYSKTPIEYVEVSIPDFTEDQQVSEAVIDAANKVVELNDTIHLHLDYNGGQRYVAFMLLAIANLMKIRCVDIKQIMTMNFENKKDQIIPIQNMAPVFESFDLISGINEYINYGRIKGLKTYFAYSQNQEIHQLLNAMEVFANNLQLCRTGYILREKEQLLRLLVEYTEKGRENKQLDTYEQLFLYVVKDILEGYRGLLDGELPDIIKWCVERDFIQQGLTFCVEEMPDYFWKQSIFKATNQEKKEYDYFLDKLGNADAKRFQRIKNDYQSAMDKSSSKYAYNWMIKYLTFSSDQQDYKDIMEDSEEEYTQFIYIRPTFYKLKEIRDSLGKFKEYDMSRVSVKSEQMNRAKRGAEKLLYHRSGKRVCSNGMKTNVLTETLMIYFLLKEQRNATNHANGGASDGNEWTYNELCSVLIQLAEKLMETKNKRMQ